MKKFLLDFLHRGLVACGCGPLVLAVVYWTLHSWDAVELLTVEEVCTGIVSLTGLAFLAGGLNALHQVERLPLAVTVLIHGSVLYGGYLATYLLNGWLDGDMLPILVFTGIFVAGYFLIWLGIYITMKRKTAKLNAILKQKQKETTDP